jgi:FAD:protein FMN transferase
MGMPVAIEVLDDIEPSALTEAFARLRCVDATFSTYRRDSQISQLDRGTLQPQAAHADVREVLACCEAHRVATGGFFDIRATGRLDPSGFVKGWAVERAAAILERAGARRFCINAGGDVLVRGGRPWRIGIRHPRLQDRLAGVVALRDGAVATSGAYERGPHVVDPHTGRPPSHTLSVTVLGRDLGTADAYATAAFAMGVEGPAWTASLSRQGFEAMTILDDDRVLTTRAFLEHCPGGAVWASLCGRRLRARLHPLAPLAWNHQRNQRAREQDGRSHRYRGHEAIDVVLRR